MVDLNETILPQLKEKDPGFPDIDRGVLIYKVCFLIFRPYCIEPTTLELHTLLFTHFIGNMGVGYPKVPC